MRIIQYGYDFNNDIKIYEIKLKNLTYVSRSKDDTEPPYNVK